MAGLTIEQGFHFETAVLQHFCAAVVGRNSDAVQRHGASRRFKIYLWPQPSPDLAGSGLNCTYLRAAVTSRIPIKPPARCQFKMHLVWIYSTTVSNEDAALLSQNASNMNIVAMRRAAMLSSAVQGFPL